MNRVGVIVLAAVGPLFVGVLRFVLPWYAISSNTGAAAAVSAHSGRESAVLWCGLGAMLTLVPGLYALRPHMPAGRLRAIGFTLATIGYLSVPGLLVTDDVLWAGAHQHLAPRVVGGLVGALHPAVLVQTILYVPPHVIGIVLIGVLALRANLVPKPAAWALIVSQPLHFAAAVFIGSPQVDLLAWGLTALGMAWLAARVIPGRVPTLEPVAVPQPA